ncbi:MAG: hypothetical protein AB1816_10050, partial [Bacillota bacterium]
MAIVHETPESYKAETPNADRGASGGPAAQTEGARWLLCSREENATDWLDRVAERLNPFALGSWRLRREANTRLAWAKA